MSVFHFLHRDVRDRFYRKPFTTSILPLRAAPATPGRLETIPVHDPPSCGHQRELSESQHCLHTASVPATLNSSRFPETLRSLSYHCALVSHVVPSAWNTHLPLPCCGSLGAQLHSSVTMPSQGPRSLFWLAEGERDGEGEGTAISYCLALNCTCSIGSSYSHSPVVTSSHMVIPGCKGHWET